MTREQFVLELDRALHKDWEKFSDELFLVLFKTRMFYLKTYGL